MASSILVADYGSSDSENEEETSVLNASFGKRGSKQQQPSSLGVNLLSSTGDGSDSDDTANDNVKRTQAKSDSKNKESERLPLPSALGIPSSLGESAGDLQAPSSIYANPFEEAEQHKLSILEQHVKLTSAQKKEAELGGKKKICWKFRNGRCRFGHKCKFAHDSDVPSTLTAAVNQEDTVVHEQSSFHQQYVVGDGLQQEGWGEAGEEDEVQQTRKRRPGLSQTLVPSKKVMTAYDRQRRQEKPWSQHR